MHSRPVDQHCWYPLGKRGQQLVQGGESQYPQWRQSALDELEGVRTRDYGGFLCDYRGGTGEETAEELESDGLGIELHLAFPRSEIANPVHVCGGYLRCIHGWSEASDPSTDRPSR